MNGASDQRVVEAVGAGAAIERVITGFAGEPIIAPAAEDRVVTGHPEELVRAVVADDRVALGRTDCVFDIRDAVGSLTAANDPRTEVDGDP